MKAPLDQFAARIVRNGEVEEFILGLIDEERVPVAQIRQILDKRDDRNALLGDLRSAERRGRRQRHPHDG